MFCPYYKNKEVFDRFNEVIKAFKGEPMTEEEFRSKDLRRLRTGRNFLAMELAYKVYDRNGGHFLDETPEGKPSILFDTLLNYFSQDRTEAIRAKAAVYSDEFFDWFGNWIVGNREYEIDDETKQQVSLIFKRNPELLKYGTEELYALYLQTIFPDSVDKSVYWHGSNEDFSQGFLSAKRGKGSGALETRERNDFYLAKQAWSVLQYVDGVNRKSVDKNGFAHWNKLWWELKEIMSNGRRENNDWKDIVINEETVRQAIPNKRGEFDRDSGGEHGKWLKERKLDYGYENKSDKEFFEEILGVKWGEDTFNTWTQRNAEIFKSLQETQKGIYPAVINTLNPIRESGENTYYEEQRGLMSKADKEGNDAILGANTDNEFNSDVAVVLRENKNVHFLGTDEDVKQFSRFVKQSNVSKVVDSNGEPLVVWIGTSGIGRKNSNPFKRSQSAILASINEKDALKYGFTNPVYINIKYDYSDYVNQDSLSNFINQYDNIYLIESEGPYENINKHKLAGVSLPDNIGIINTKQYKSDTPSDYIVTKGNQIKHVENLGTWDPDTGNIYKVKLSNLTKNIISEYGFNEQLSSTNNLNFFGEQFDLLNEGNSASSGQLMRHLLDTKQIQPVDIILAEVLSRHDVPIIFGKNEFGTPAQIAEKDGLFVIIIDPELFLSMRTAESAYALMHEIVHALTVKIIDNPVDATEIELRDATHKLFVMFLSEMSLAEYSRFNSITGAYILSDEHEFISEFVTNQNSRQVLYEKAAEIDLKNNGKVRLRLKRFINAVTNFLVNKKVFKLERDKLQDYHNKLKQYIFYKQSIKKGNITDAQLFEAVYNSFDNVAADNQRDMYRRQKMIMYLDGMVKHNIETGQLQQQDQQLEQLDKDVNSEEIYDINSIRSWIASSLLTRMLSFKTSAFTEEQKAKYTQIVLQHINMFANKQIKTVVALSQFIEDVIPLLLQDIDEVRGISESTDDYYMLMMHDNFGTYAAILTKISKLLSNPEYYSAIENELKSLSNLDRIGAIKNMSNLKTMVNQGLDVALDGKGHMLYVLMNNLKARAKDISIKTGSDEYEKWVDEFKRIGYDTKKALSSWGAKDGASDTTLRALLYLINDANNKKEKAVYNIIDTLLKSKDNLSSNQSIRDIYEFDEGKATGNVVRAINYGKFKRLEKEAIKKINKYYGLPEDNYRIPDDNTLVEYKSLFIPDSKHNYDPKKDNKITLRRAWNLLKNEWLSLNAERKYKAEYYDAYAGLSEETLEAINSIRDMINLIKKKCQLDKDGHYLFSSLSDEDWKTLTGLYIQRKIMSSPIRMDGTLKKEGTPEYNIAKELQELNERLYERSKDYHDKTAWEEARKKELLRLTELFTNKDTGEIDTKAVGRGIDKWDVRNSKRVFKRDIENNPALFVQIDDEILEVCDLEEAPIFDFNGDGGATYKENKKRINLTLNNFRKPDGEVSLDFLPASVKKKVKELQDENTAIRKNAIKNDKTGKLRRQWRAYNRALKKVFKKYFITTKTSEWVKKYENNFSGNALFSSVELDMKDLPRWATKLVLRDVKDEDGISFIDKYTELVPGDGWISQEDRKDLINPEFERLSQMEGNENESVIPKPEIYDNSEAFNKIKDSSLYKNTVDVIRSCNLEFYNNENANSYRLPQITGSMLNYVLSTGAKGAWKYIKEQIGVKGDGLSIRQDDQFGMNVDSVLDSFQDFAETVNKKSEISVSSVKGSRADGRQFNVVPPRYTTPLDDPSQISKDLIGILCEFYDSAMNVKYKSEIKDTVESFIDMIEYREYVKEKTDRKTGKKIQHITAGKDTTTYAAARKAADMFLYGIKSESVEAGNWNISKTAQLAKLATTAINLGASPVVALTGFFTASYAHLINSIVGDKAYGFFDALNAAGITLWSFIKTGFGVTTMANQLSNDKVMGLMEMFNITDQLTKKYKKSHQNRFMRFLSNNYIFGMLTGLDYMIKSNIAVSLCLSHRLVNGEFITKEDIRNGSKDLSIEEYSERVKVWNEGISVWDALEMKNNVLTVKPEYREAFDKIYDVLKARITKTAEGADGMATETQKAAITSNIYGAAILIHRQYLPLMLQDRWSKTVYDMDTQLYKQGMFRTIADAFGVQLYLAAKAAYTAHKLDKQTSYFSNFRSEIKNRYQRMFNDKETEESFKLSRARRKHLKKFITELAMFAGIFKLLMPLLYGAADDKKNKDKLLLLLAAYVGRRTEWETFTPYRLEDVTASIKTLTAETSLVDKAESFINDLMPRINLFSALYDSDLKYQKTNGVIKRGPYKNWSRFNRSAFKLFLPYHNIYELIKGSKEKRRYYENQIMHIND